MKSKTVYICQNCGYQSPQWIGQCPDCSGWNTMEETINQPLGAVLKGSGIGVAGGKSQKPVYLSSVSSKSPVRVSSMIGEFDRVLGGGFVPGQVVLLSGEPGIGKSTLITQIAKNMTDKKILYVSGEESFDQVRIRANRMNYVPKNLLMLSETNVDLLEQAVSGESGIGLIIVDSIQTLVSYELTGMAGSVGQVRGSAQKLTNLAKNLSIPMILVGHVTKDGTVAGPKVLEHIVDTVLYLEGDSQHMFRLLKTTKNRFGPVSEIGIFEMTEEGMNEVSNPSEVFLGQTSESVSGSCVTCVMEGYRPILFEIQALTSKTSFGYPKRTTSGFNTNRLQVLIAILEKRCGLNLSNYDVYLNIAGGFKVSEYACDLAVCLAIASSIKDKPVKKGTIAFGECGLSGEVRRVSHEDKRIKEAKKLGYKNVISPESIRYISQAIKTGLVAV